MRNEIGTLSFSLVPFASFGKVLLLLPTYGRMNNEKATINQSIANVFVHSTLDSNGFAELDRNRKGLMKLSHENTKWAA